MARTAKGPIPKNILQEWDTEKNGADIHLFKRTSRDKHWWTCPNCHNSYQSSLMSRVYAGSGCPYCSGNGIKEGFNDFQSRHPELMKEWNFEKNDKLGIYPNKITSQSGKRAWWKCAKCGTEWRTSVQNRTGLKSGCPKCNKGQGIKVQQFTKDGQFVAEYDSAAQAAKSIGYPFPQNILSCCRGKYKSIHGYKWKFCDPEQT